MHEPIEILNAVLADLRKTTPSFAWNDARTGCLRRLEEVLNANCGEGQPFDLYHVDPNPVWEAVVPQLQDAIREAAATTVPPDTAMLWQLYNSGMLVKSGNSVLAFDVIAMPRFFGWNEPRELTEQIADVVDALFITHRHKDHCDLVLIQACLERGKPVFLPESIAATLSPSPYLHPMSHGSRVNAAEAQVTGRLGFHVWREELNDPPLIYYEVTLPNGYAFIFAGDLDYTKKFERTPDKQIDLLIIPWRNPNQKFEEGHEEQEASTLDAVQIAQARIQPRALIHNHYGELDHIYRWATGASYGIALNLKQQCSTPSEVLFWGERLRLPLC